MKDTERNVLITHLDLSHDWEAVKKIVKRSRLLINSICQYSKDLKKKDVIVEERHVNIIKTNIGYFCAFYEDDIKENRTKQKEETTEQFEGLDGRMKTVLHDDNGEEIVKDVAEMVAIMFVPNPDNYEYVKHKDGDTKNNNYINLYWSKFK